MRIGWGGRNEPVSVGASILIRKITPAYFLALARRAPRDLARSETGLFIIAGPVSAARDEIGNGKAFG